MQKKKHRALSQAVTTNEMTDKLVGIRVLEYEYEISRLCRSRDSSHFLTSNRAPVNSFLFGSEGVLYMLNIHTYPFFTCTVSRGLVSHAIHVTWTIIVIICYVCCFCTICIMNCVLTNYLTSYQTFGILLLYW